MSASVFANARYLIFGAKSEDLSGRPGTNTVTLEVSLQRYNSQFGFWENVATAGDAYGHEPYTIVFGDVETEGYSVEPTSLQEWHTAQSGDRIVYKTGEDAGNVFVTINLVS